MKVLHLNSYGRFSTGNIAGTILSGLDESDEKKLIYANDTSDYSFAVKINDKASRCCHIVLNKLFGKHGTYSRINTFRIIREIKRFNPDILHLHNLHGYYLNYPMLFRYIKKHNVKVVWTLHDCWSFTGYCAYYDKAKCFKWKTGCFNCPLHDKEGYKTIPDTSKSEYKRKMKSFCGVKNLTIVTPSQWLKEQVKQSFLKDYPIKVVQNCVRTDVFNYVENTKQGDKKTVLAVAFPWTSRKGYLDVLELATLLPQEYEICMVGVNDVQYNEAIGYGIKAVKKTDSQQKLAQIYQSASVFVNPTYEDVFGLVNIEALACGTPVVTYATGGCVELVNDENGSVVEKGNVKELARQVQEVCKKDIDRRKISNDAVAKYSQANMVDGYKRIYNELV